MTPASARAREEDPGGRLPLLAPAAMTGATADLHARLVSLVGPESTAAGYRAQLDDGALIGPFNAMLRTPALTDGLAGWVARIAGAGIPAEMREAIILTVGASWGAAYALSAHKAAARSAGLSAVQIDALVAAGVPPGLGRAARLAQRMTLALLRDRAVPDALYDELLDELGVERMIACLHLVAQYQLICSLLVLFEVPAPAP